VACLSRADRARVHRQSGLLITLRLRLGGIFLQTTELSCKRHLAYKAV
jgi:hypothetical protein